MESFNPVAKRYRSILIASLLSSGSLLQLVPALADQNSAAPGLIENTATGSFVDDADGTNTPQTILSNNVTATVAEIAGISATAQPLAASNTLNPGEIVYFDFIVKNIGNDQSQMFIPGAPSVATVNGVAVTPGTLQVVAYSANGTTETPITANNNVAAAGSPTGDLTGITNGGSIPAGGYVKVRVPITVPIGSKAGEEIKVTLGNSTTQNTPYVQGATGTGGNDLYTQDNPNLTNGETVAANGAPFNGDSVNHRQEASATQTASVLIPTVKISGRAWDDKNGSGQPNFSNINPGNLEDGANVAPPTPIFAILVDANNKVIKTTPVINSGTSATNGTYEFTGVDGFQDGLSIILSTDGTLAPGAPAPAPSLPAGWAGTTPLSYDNITGTTPVTNRFSTAKVDVVNKDFGIERLPETTTPATPVALPNPVGVTTAYQVPTLAGTDPEDPSVTSFRIDTIPNPTTQGILYYDADGVGGNPPVAVTPGQVIDNYDPAKLTFDPVDGAVTMTFTYSAKDAAGKFDPTPATVTMPFSAPIVPNVTIKGTVWNDINNSANGTFGTPATPIQNGTEPGTDTKFGTSQTTINAILVDDTGKVLKTVPVGADGKYTFADIAPNTPVKVILSATPGTVGNTLTTTTGDVPEGWVKTSPTVAAFNTGAVDINDKDFGVRQKSKLVLLKRITKVNGAAINPNDGLALNTVMTSDTFNNVGNWPTGYVVGSNDAGKVKPGDTIEYTIYFLNNQGVDAKDVKICDPIKGAQTYVPGTISLKLGGATTETALTDGFGAEDLANSYTAGSVPAGCSATTSTTDPGVAVGITGGIAVTTQPTIPGATGIGAPVQSYGLFRFTTKVKP